MSFLFSGGGGSAANPSAQSEVVQSATTEIEMITDLFSKLVNSCHKKCIETTYKDSDLNKAEGVCLDRCVGKYFETSKLVTEQLQKLQQQPQQ
ncbi:hypothetical protein E3P99_03165 [Wallemia hederae]|uniref:Mitochondrial import inner membrane translocase subunit n=1 Tax=Wallemia hederae TaxID=1540922 RepID=A0A4T0FJA6_9BASI|nr:hypothetical protein E3P99_03165 [Wallemia hederae]